MQPLEVTPEFACIDTGAGKPLHVVAAEQFLDRNVDLLKASSRKRKIFNYVFRWDRHFDWVIYYHFGSDKNPLPDVMRPVRDGSFFSIYRVIKPAAFLAQGCASPQAA